jgi:hypothetical protein
VVHCPPPLFLWCWEGEQGTRKWLVTSADVSHGLQARDGWVWAQETSLKSTLTPKVFLRFGGCLLDFPLVFELTLTTVFCCTQFLPRLWRGSSFLFHFFPIVELRISLTNNVIVLCPSITGCSGLLSYPCILPFSSTEPGEVM